MTVWKFNLYIYILERMPKRHRRNYSGGGMPLSYLNKHYVEPSAAVGSTVNVSEPLLARPVLNPRGGGSRVRRKTRCRRCVKVGGFSPGVMGSFIQNAKALIPAVGVTGYRMWKNFGKTRKNRY